MNLGSRKFILAGFFSITAFILQIMGQLSSEYVTIATLVLGVYGTVNVMDKKRNVDSAS